MAGDGSPILSETTLKNGEKLVMRRPCPDDAAKIIEYLNIVGGESDNLLFGENEITFSVEEEKVFITNINKAANTLMILGFLGDLLVSVAQISCPQRPRIMHNGELAISVRKCAWRKGVGTAVMTELMRFAEENPVIKNIHLGVKADNTNAIHLYEKFGFRQAGIHHHYFQINGVYDDEILMDRIL